MPVDAFNRRFDAYLDETLAENFADAAAAYGGNSRLEKIGTALLRSICKLAFDGHGAHVKGDGLEFRQFLEDKYPHLTTASVGRAELSKRQDWSLEVSEKILPLVPALLEYLVDQLILDANILRDSTLQRLELHHFEAFIHVNGAMWATGFEELRFLTNANVVHLNPMECHTLYESLWELGFKVQQPNALDILEDDYRPLPRLRTDDEKVASWYERRDAEMAIYDPMVLRTSWYYVKCWRFLERGFTNL